MIDLTPIINAVIGIAAAVVTAYVIPWLKSKTDAAERKELLAWADIAVAAAQQLYHHLDGETRKAYALSFLQDKGFDIDDQSVVDAMEAAVLKLHQQLEAADG